MPTLNPRETLDRALQELLDDILVLGSMVDGAVREAVSALKQRDLLASEKVYQADENINKKHFDIEDRCITLIATQQPMAKDLRLLPAVIEISTEL